MEGIIFRRILNQRKMDELISTTKDLLSTVDVKYGDSRNIKFK